MDNREMNFLGVAKKFIYENQNSSPYRKLLLWAGCDYKDLEDSVRHRGIEKTLEKLHDEGVYITLEEFKSKVPICQKGLTIKTSEADFNNTFLMGKGIQGNQQKENFYLFSCKDLEMGKKSENVSGVSRGDVQYKTTRCWSDYIFASPVSNPVPESLHTIGVLKGEGIGPEVVQAALQVLSSLESTGLYKFDVRYGGPIGLDSESHYGKPLCDGVIEFCRSIFSRGGAILSGPGGGRFVYDLRKRFDLFCKLTPLTVFGELINACRMKPEYLHNVDILLIRENKSGIYQGQWKEVLSQNEGLRAEHSFSYTEKDVRRILKVAARIAKDRRGEMVVVLKEAGIFAISKLWRNCAAEIASEFGINYSLINIDYAAYRFIQHAQELDVVVAPNLFGDILSDIGAVLLGSRALSHSGNFSSDRAAVYQTNHGSAYDLVGSDKANPIGQIFSLAMLLRESFGLIPASRLIENAVAEVWRQGWRTADLAENGCRLVGTREMGNLIAEAVIRLS
jgi:3-isopropylmalate dehydrogenase